MESNLSLKEKFVFCVDWFRKHSNGPDNATRHQGIMNELFKGSKSSSNFIGNAITHKPSDFSYERYFKHTGTANATKFIEKIYPIFLDL